jgi:hypothetical protein
METCPSCGEPAYFEIAEVFPDLREVHIGDNRWRRSYRDGIERFSHEFFGRPVGKL